MTEEERAKSFPVSLYPDQIRYIKALAARRFRYNVSAATQAIVAAHREQHPEIDLADGDWKYRREDR